MEAFEWMAGAGPDFAAKFWALTAAIGTGVGWMLARTRGKETDEE